MRTDLRFSVCVLSLSRGFVAALGLLAALATPLAIHAQIVISGNENKIDVSTGTPVSLFDAEPDSISVIDFAEFPPRVQHVTGIRNSVIGPPSNVAIAPSGQLALVASSLKLDRQAEEGHVPDTVVHIIDLTQRPPRVVGQVQGGQQPSGISIAPDGSFALVANRADGTVTMLSIDGMDVKVVQSIEVAGVDDQVSDVAISPDGKMALVSVHEDYLLAVLAIEDGRASLTEQQLSVCGKPYRTVITADGQLGLTVGSGVGPPNLDALTVVDLTADPIRSIDYVPLGLQPESFGVSPDGQLVAAMMFNGSTLPKDDPSSSSGGQLVILARRGMTYEPVQRLPLGRVTQGAAFTADGKFLLAQCYVDREIRVYRVQGESVEDTGHRIKTPGFPASLRASR